jgi:anti-sigma B factor antagonist
MVIDFQNVQYLSSKMLGKLMALYKRVQAEDGGLALCSVRKELREVFEVTQLDKVLNLQADQAKAVDSLKKKKGGWL